MLGPHIFGRCLVTFFMMAIKVLQSARCSSLARDAMYSSTLASVAFVLFSAIAVTSDGIALPKPTPAARVKGAAPARRNGRRASNVPAILGLLVELKRHLTILPFSGGLAGDRPGFSHKSWQDRRIEGHRRKG